MADDESGMTGQARLEACLGPDGADPGRWFAEPQAVVETDGSYDDRLAVLQRWRVQASVHEDASVLREVEEAITALEQRAALGQERPEGAETRWGYGVPR